jgi:hypothetical protein
MGLKGRIRKLEEEKRNPPEAPCEECGGVILTEEIMEDGSVRYLDREPCLVCGSRGSAEVIGRIVVDTHGREDERGRGDMYELVPFDE